MKKPRSLQQMKRPAAWALAPLLLPICGCESDNPLLLEGLSLTSNTVNLTIELLFNLLTTWLTGSPGG